MPIITEGLVGYWNSRQGVEGNIWENISPTTTGEFNGVIKGVTVTGNGMYFDGVDDKIDIPVPTSLRQPTPFTLELYINMESYNANLMANGSNYLIDFYEGEVTVRLEATTGVSRIYEFEHDMQLNVGYHLAFLFNPVDESMRFFINGELADSYQSLYDDPFVFSSSGEFSLGSPYTNYWIPKGTIDSVKLYNRLLTASELTQNYTMGLEVGLPEEDPPIVTNIVVDRSILSYNEGHNEATVNFEFDSDIVEWRLVLAGGSHDTGTLLAGGGGATVGEPIQATIQSALLQPGDNRVNIYGRSISGKWTMHSQE